MVMFIDRHFQYAQHGGIQMSIVWGIDNIWNMDLTWQCKYCVDGIHDDGMIWKGYLHYWPFVRGIHL